MRLTNKFPVKIGILLVVEGEEEGVSIGREKRGKARVGTVNIWTMAGYSWRFGRRWIFCVFRSQSKKVEKLEANKQGSSCFIMVWM